MEFFWIWLYITLSKLGAPVVLATWWSLLVSTFFIWAIAHGEGYKPRMLVKFLFFSYLFLGFAVHLTALAVPGKEEMAYIIGGGVALKISQTEEAQKLPENTLKALNRFLENIATEEEVTQ